jgi:hypothetical protein
MITYLVDTIWNMLQKYEANNEKKMLLSSAIRSLPHSKISNIVSGIKETYLVIFHFKIFHN